MLHKPEFSEPHPTVEFLRSEQDRLHRQADKMIAETGVMDTLANHGTFSGIRGSYDYGLMIYPDLDVGLVAERVDRVVLAPIVHDLTLNNAIQKLRIGDHVHFQSLHHAPGVLPKGYWIGIEIPFEGDVWGIDRWVQQPEWVVRSYERYKDRLMDLDQSGKDAILQIKYELIRTKAYGKPYGSIDVYDAVLAGDRTLEAFYARQSNDSAE